MGITPSRCVWIFTGGGHFPGGVFSSIANAEAWIDRNRLSGTLTAYPIDQGCFDWAVENHCTNLALEKLESKRNDPKFIASFSTGSQEHFHYVDGKPA